MKSHFIDKATTIIASYKEINTDKPGYRYNEKPIYVSINSDDSIFCSMSNDILCDSKEALIILPYSEISLTNFYRYYDIRYITQNGEVLNCYNNEFRIDSYRFGNDKHAIQRFILSYNGDIISSIIIDHSDVIKSVKEIWALYQFLKNCETLSEMKWAAKYYFEHKSCSILEKEYRWKSYEADFYQRQLVQLNNVITEIKQIISVKN